MNEPKTCADWDKTGLPMVWSIFKGDTADTDLDNWRLDFAAGVPDGEYSVVGRHAGVEHEPEPGIVVRGGEFVPEPTAMACYRLQARLAGLTPEEIEKREVFFDHVFIEELWYDARQGVFLLWAGS